MTFEEKLEELCRKQRASADARFDPGYSRYAGWGDVGRPKVLVERQLVAVPVYMNRDHGVDGLAVEVHIYRLLEDGDFWCEAIHPLKWVEGLNIAGRFEWLHRLEDLVPDLNNDVGVSVEVSCSMECDGRVRVETTVWWNSRGRDRTPSQIAMGEAYQNASKVLGEEYIEIQF